MHKSSEEWIKINEDRAAVNEIREQRQVLQHYQHKTLRQKQINIDQPINFNLKPQKQLQSSKSVPSFFPRKTFEHRATLMQGHLRSSSQARLKVEDASVEQVQINEINKANEIPIHIRELHQRFIGKIMKSNDRQVNVSERNRTKHMIRQLSEKAIHMQQRRHQRIEKVKSQMGLSQNRAVSQGSHQGVPLLSGSKSGYFAHSNLLQKSETHYALEDANKKANIDDLDKISMNYNINVKTTHLRKLEEKDALESQKMVEQQRQYLKSQSDATQRTKPSSLINQTFFPTHQREKIKTYLRTQTQFARQPTLLRHQRDIQTPEVTLLQDEAPKDRVFRQKSPIIRVNAKKKYDALKQINSQKLQIAQEIASQSENLLPPTPKQEIPVKEVTIARLPLKKTLFSMDFPCKDSSEPLSHMNKDIKPQEYISPSKKAMVAKKFSGNANAINEKNTKPVVQKSTTPTVYQALKSKQVMFKEPIMRSISPISTAQQAHKQYILTQKQSPNSITTAAFNQTPELRKITMMLPTSNQTSSNVVPSSMKYLQSKYNMTKFGAVSPIDSQINSVSTIVQDKWPSIAKQFEEAQNKLQEEERLNEPKKYLYLQVENGTNKVLNPQTSSAKNVTNCDNELINLGASLPKTIYTGQNSDTNSRVNFTSRSRKNQDSPLSYDSYMKTNEKKLDKICVEPVTPNQNLTLADDENTITITNEETQVLKLVKKEDATSNIEILRQMQKVKSMPKLKPKSIKNGQNQKITNPSMDSEHSYRKTEDGISIGQHLPTKELNKNVIRVQNKHVQKFKPAKLPNQTFSYDQSEPSSMIQSNPNEYSISHQLLKQQTIENDCQERGIKNNSQIEKSSPLNDISPNRPVTNVIKYTIPVLEEQIVEKPKNIEATQNSLMVTLISSENAENNTNTNVRSVLLESALENKKKEVTSFSPANNQNTTHRSTFKVDRNDSPSYLDTIDHADQNVHSPEKLPENGQSLDRWPSFGDSQGVRKSSGVSMPSPLIQEAKYQSQSSLQNSISLETQIISQEAAYQMKLQSGVQVKNEIQNMKSDDLSHLLSNRTLQAQPPVTKTFYKEKISPKAENFNFKRYVDDMPLSKPTVTFSHKTQRIAQLNVEAKKQQKDLKSSLKKSQQSQSSLQRLTKTELFGDSFKNLNKEDKEAILVQNALARMPMLYVQDVINDNFKETTGHAMTIQSLKPSNTTSFTKLKKQK